MMSAFTRHMIVKWLAKPYFYEANTHLVGGGIRRIRFIRRKPRKKTTGDK